LLGDRVALDERVREVPLTPHDLAAVSLEREGIAGRAKPLALELKPSEEILEGFDGERFPPARGGCGLRRG
jgi:hypothetical protein